MEHKTLYEAMRQAGQAAAPPQAVNCLHAILRNIEQIPFADRAGCEPSELLQKHFVVLTVDELTRKAQAAGHPLAILNEQLHVFTGLHWVPVEGKTARWFCGEASYYMGAPELDARHYDFRNKLYQQLTDYTTKAEPPAGTRINLLNGTLYFPDGEPELKPHTAADYLTHCLPFEYTRQSYAPEWQQFLNEVLPESDKQAVLQEFLAWLFIPTSELKLEKALLLYGNGSNGKSVVFEVISAMLGHANVSNYSLSDLTDTRGYHRAELPGHLVNFASEINTKVGVDKFKALVSGEPIDARHPYGVPFTIEDYAKFIFSANELPSDIEQTHAFFRRFLILPFERTIPDSKQDKHLPQRIIERELPGVLNWCMEALPRLRQQAGFSECEAAARALKRFQVESDSVQLYLEDIGMQAGDEERERLTELYGHYRLHIREAGMQACKRDKFRKRLEGLGFRVSKMNTGKMVYYQLKSDASDAPVTQK